jgi:hypothetical protein
MTRPTAIGAFELRAGAEQAIGDLLEAGFRPGQVGLVHNGEPSGVRPPDAVPVTLFIGEMFLSVIGAEISAPEARHYEQALQEGRFLVVVRAADRYPEAVEILYRNGGRYMDPF